MLEITISDFDKSYQKSGLVNSWVYQEEDYASLINQKSISKRLIPP